jgi:hypothetical protein
LVLSFPCIPKVFNTMFSTPPRGRKFSLPGVGGTPQTQPRSAASQQQGERFLLTEQNQVKVVVRIRPMNATEQRHGCKSMLYPAIVGSSSDDDDIMSTSITADETNSSDDDEDVFAVERNKSLNSISPSAAAAKPIPKTCFVSTIQRSFEFDAVYGPDVTQKEFFESSIGSSITHNVLEAGFNTTIIAYGVTGSGKTYTMSDVVARAVTDLFTPRHGELTSPVIRLSCLEVYKEDLYDLLDGCTSATPGSNMRLRDHGDSVTVEGLTLRTVRSLEDVQAHLEQANAKRTVASTRLNEHSSRSHAITTLTVAHNDRLSKVTFVDLAGSERIAAAGVQGTIHAKESIHINTDLFVLAKVVHALAAGFKHVPFRDSNLTRLLRDSLGGNCRTTLIACVSPAATNDDTTVATLRYAERARSITNRVKTNYDLSSITLTPAQCIVLQEENRALKARLQNLLDSQATAATTSGPHPAEAKLRQLREQAAAAAQRTRHWMEYLDEQDDAERSAAYQEIKQLLKDEQSFGRELLHLVNRADSNEYTDEYGKNRVQYEIKMIAQSLSENNDKMQTFLQEYSGQLAEPRCDYEAKYRALTDDIEFVNGENDILTQQNKKLQDVVKRLKEELEIVQSAKRVAVAGSTKEERVAPSHTGLGSRAESLLAWAEGAITNEANNINESTSSFSSAGTDFKPSLAVTMSASSNDENEMVISNMPTAGICACQDSIFTKNPDHVEFYLPNIRVLCSCGKHGGIEKKQAGSDPCSLENILRPWQFGFLQSVGILTASDLILVANKSTKVLSRAMRRWRKQNGLRDVKSKSCSVALHIWTRTSKAVVQSVQDNKGVVRPDFLDVSLSGDERTISTIDVSLSDHHRLQGIDEC